MKLIEDIGYDVSFSFIFSPRPCTPAAEIKDDTPHEVKLARLQRLQNGWKSNNLKSVNKWLAKSIKSLSMVILKTSGTHDRTHRK